MSGEQNFDIDLPKDVESFSITLNFKRGGTPRKPQTPDEKRIARARFLVSTRTRFGVDSQAPSARGIGAIEFARTQIKQRGMAESMIALGNGNFYDDLELILGHGEVLEEMIRAFHRDQITLGEIEDEFGSAIVGRVKPENTMIIAQMTVEQLRDIRRGMTL